MVTQAASQDFNCGTSRELLWTVTGRPTAEEERRPVSNELRSLLERVEAKDPGTAKELRRHIYALQSRPQFGTRRWQWPLIHRVLRRLLASSKSTSGTPNVTGTRALPTVFAPLNVKC